MPEWKREITGRLAAPELDPAREAEIVEELSQRLGDRYAESQASGASPEDAHRATLAELSGGELLAHELRRGEKQVASEPITLGTNRRTNMLTDLWQDLRFGARMLLKQPGFTLIAALTLSLGEGGSRTTQ